MVNPGGTGSPMDIMSARFAPFPPRRFFMLAVPSALPSPKKYTYLFFCVDIGNDPLFFIFKFFLTANVVSKNPLCQSERVHCITSKLICESNQDGKHYTPVHAV
jgi:hypothetical protein